MGIAKWHIDLKNKIIKDTQYYEYKQIKAF